MAHSCLAGLVWALVIQANSRHRRTLTEAASGQCDGAAMGQEGDEERDDDVRLVRRGLKIGVGQVIIRLRASL
jgi:hypothetical protein